MDADFSRVGRALAAPARSAMVSLLLDGQTHTAGELARIGGVASGTASGHLAVLVESGLVTVRADGRFRRYAIADPRTAEALETLGSEPEMKPVTSYRLSREQQRVRAARTCYDHLAGQLGVGLARVLVERGWVSEQLTDVPDVRGEGLRALGVDVPHLRRARRSLVRPCLDWTERESHVAGSVGAAIADTALERRWVARVRGSRGLRVTAEGVAALVDLGLPSSHAALAGAGPRP